MIGIVDYGAGNLASVRGALDQLGYEASIFDRAEGIGDCERLILPGVGSFRRAMETLEEKGWTKALSAYASSGRPLLGICLGMQVLFGEGEEHGSTRGLGLIPGRVVMMTPQKPLRVPHVGWNDLTDVRKHPLFEGIKPHVDLYFTHSYHCVVEDPAHVMARCDYGGPFVASAGRDNIAAVQFHPEKSQPVGLRILENFANWDGSC